MTMQVCIVGAGLAGLCATKYALGYGMKPTVFEQTSTIGGTWVYTDKTGKDEFNLDIHSSMYKGLRTNLPKELMGFSDFPMPDQEKCYIAASDVLEFLHLYADKFDIIKTIKFQHHVLKIEPLHSGKWQVTVKYLPQNLINIFEFDYIMVCNGHYNSPFIPNYVGRNTFEGKQFHSHEFRSSESLRDENVLIIGAGPSGRDLAYEISKVAENVTISHHLSNPLNIPSNIIQMPDIKEFKQNSVEFSNGLERIFTVIIYCTGYIYNFPFLTEASGITVDNNYVQPLYKHCFNINYPTMVFIGLPFRAQISLMIDIQIRFVMKYFVGDMKLPSLEEMMRITQNEMDDRWRKGYKKRHAHVLGEDYRDKYYTELSELAGIENIKPVLNKLITENTRRLNEDLINYRNDIYKIIDDEHFIKLN